MRVISEYNRFDNPAYSKVLTVHSSALDACREDVIKKQGWSVARLPFWLMYRHDPSQTAGVAGGHYGLIQGFEVEQLARNTIAHVAAGPPGSTAQREQTWEGAAN